MQAYLAYEFKDLEKTTQKEIYNKELNDLVTFHMEVILPDAPDRWQALIDRHGQMYLDTTPWFVPECYLELFRSELSIELKYQLLNSLFTKGGNFIDLK